MFQRCVGFTMLIIVGFLESCTPAFASPLEEKKMAAGPLRVPVHQLAEMDDSCRSWVMVFTNSAPDADGQFLLDAYQSFGFGHTVRFKHITEKSASAWSQWGWLHGSQNTIATLNPDQSTVMSVVNQTGRLNDGNPAAKIPAYRAADWKKDQVMREQNRRLDLAALLVLEDPEGKRGRLFDSAKPPFWLPNRRAELWAQRCPGPQPNVNPGPGPNVNVDVGIRQPQMDPALQAAIAAEERAKAEAAALKEAEDIRLEKEAWEAEQRKKDAGNVTAIAIVLGLLAMVTAPIVGVVIANYFGGD